MKVFELTVLPFGRGQGNESELVSYLSGSHAIIFSCRSLILDGTFMFFGSVLFVCSS